MNALDPTVAEFRERLKHQRTGKRWRRTGHGPRSVLEAVGMEMAFFANGPRSLLWSSLVAVDVGDLSSRAAGKPPRIGRDPRPSLADIPRKETISTAD